MFQDLQKAMSIVSHMILCTEKKSLFTDVTFLKKCRNSGIRELQIFTTRTIFVVEPIFLHQNVCRTVAKVIISLLQVNLYCFALRKMRISVAPSRKIGNFAMVTYRPSAIQLRKYSVWKEISPHVEQQSNSSS